MNERNRPPVDPAEEPEEAISDEELFRQAMEGLATVPDKDSLDKAPKPHRPQRLKPPKSLLSPPDDHMDLHRKTVREARIALTHFVQRAKHEGFRTILIITGKGLGSKTPGGVLRAELERWLRHEGAPYVRAYSEAPRALGGRGAHLLHLRR